MSPRLLVLVLSLPMIVAGCGHGGEAASTQPSDRDFLAFCADNPGACPPQPASPTSPAPEERAEIDAAQRRPAHHTVVPSVPVAERCHARTLALSPEQISPETGEHGLVLRLTNRGARCTLAGYPRVRFDDGGRPLPFRMLRGGRYGPGGAPKRVSLHTGGHAYFIAAKYRCDGQTQSTATAIRVQIPGVAGLLRLGPLPRDPGSSLLDYCREFGSGSRSEDPGNEINVSPISTRAHLFAPS